MLWHALGTPTSKPPHCTTKVVEEREHGRFSGMCGVQSGGRDGCIEGHVRLGTVRLIVWLYN